MESARHLQKNYWELKRRERNLRIEQSELNKEKQ